MAYCGLDGMKISKTELKRHVESPIVDNISLHCRSLHDVCILFMYYSSLATSVGFEFKKYLGPSLLHYRRFEPGAAQCKH